MGADMGVKTIYLLRDPRDGRVRYVGATSNRLAKRLQLHVILSAKTTTRCAAWIRELTAARMAPSIEEILVADDWQTAERAAIAGLRAAGADLLNMADGGMGVSGCRPSDATREKRSATLKARYANDPAQMAARQELMRNAGRSQASRKAASARMTAIWSNPERAADMRARMKKAREKAC